MSLVRNPALWTGLALMAVGGGNWLNGRIKLVEYETMLDQPTAVAAANSPDEYPNLNERTTATLLEPLRTRSTGSYAEGKRDFYRVVATGGRLLAFFGAFCVAAAAYWENRRQASATA